jgi:hypothetical protein
MCTIEYIHYTKCGCYDEYRKLRCRYFRDGTCTSGELDKHDVTETRREVCRECEPTW